MKFRTAFAVIAVRLFVSAPALAAPPTIAEARASMIGRWEGKLEYRDYQADKWFGLPVAVEVKDGGDGVTLIRTADYDDGPKTGNVRITTASMLASDGRESSATFRKGRDVELETAALALDPASRDAAHWKMIETTDGTDDNRPATIRLTVIRDGAAYTALKEVRFKSGKNSDGWLARNRTSLTALPAATSAAGSSPYAPPPQVDGLLSAPGNFTKLFENAEIRVMVFRLAPGATDKAHTHPRYFGRVLSGGKIVVHFADGENAAHEMATGDTYWSDGSRLHTTENVGTTPVEIMLIEVK